MGGRANPKCLLDVCGAPKRSCSSNRRSATVPGPCRAGRRRRCRGWAEALHRIGDKRIIRLIRKWLKAGILEDGVVTVSGRGTGQGAVISPLLANIYLHYVLDLWAERWRRREAAGDMII